MLRERNQEQVLLLTRSKGLSHVEVNQALNRKVGLRKGIAEATESQLEARIRAAKEWLLKPGI